MAEIPFPGGAADGDVFFHEDKVCVYHKNINTWECRTVNTGSTEIGQPSAVTTRTVYTIPIPTNPVTGKVADDAPELPDLRNQYDANWYFAGEIQRVEEENDAAHVVVSEEIARIDGDIADLYDALPDGNSDFLSSEGGEVSGEINFTKPRTNTKGDGPIELRPNGSSTRWGLRIDTADYLNFDCTIQGSQTTQEVVYFSPAGDAEFSGDVTIEGDINGKRLDLTDKVFINRTDNNAGFIIQKGGSSKITLNGNGSAVFQGQIQAAADPTNDFHLVNKGWVEAKPELSGQLASSTTGEPVLMSQPDEGMARSEVRYFGKTSEGSSIQTKFSVEALINAMRSTVKTAVQESTDFDTLKAKLLEAFS